MRLAETAETDARTEAVPVFYPAKVQKGHQVPIFAIVPRKPRDFEVDELQDFHAATNGFVELQGCLEGTKFSRTVLPQGDGAEKEATRLAEAITKHLRFRTKLEPTD